MGNLRSGGWLAPTLRELEAAAAERGTTPGEELRRWADERPRLAGEEKARLFERFDQKHGPLPTVDPVELMRQVRSDP